MSRSAAAVSRGAAASAQREPRVAQPPTAAAASFRHRWLYSYSSVVVVIKLSKNGEIQDMFRLVEAKYGRRA